MTTSNKKQALRDIRGFCESCAPDGQPEMCPDSRCPLWECRLGVTRKGERSLSTLIHKRCMECCGGQIREVSNCSTSNCYLYNWKSGEYKENSFGESDEIDDIMCC